MEIDVRVKLMKEINSHLDTVSMPSRSKIGRMPQLGGLHVADRVMYGMRVDHAMILLTC